MVIIQMCFVVFFQKMDYFSAIATVLVSLFSCCVRLVFFSCIFMVSHSPMWWLYEMCAVFVQVYVHIFCPILMKLGIWLGVYYLYVVINLSPLRLPDRVVFSVKLPNRPFAKYVLLLRYWLANQSEYRLWIYMWPYGAIFQLTSSFLHEMPSKLAETAIWL